MRPVHPSHGTAIAAAVALLLFVSPASRVGADEEDKVVGFPEGVNSCVDLKQHLCGEHKSRSKFKRCLRQHRDSMPSLCWGKADRPSDEDVAAAAGPDFGAIWANCGESIDEHCAGQEPDALVGCLAAQRANLAAECSAVVPEPAPAPVEAAAPAPDAPAMGKPAMDEGEAAPAEEAAPEAAPQQ